VSERLSTDDRFDADDALEPEVRAEIEAFAARHRSDPPLAVLRAADVDALPSPLQEKMSATLESDHLRQQIVAGANDAAEESRLSDPDAAALLARIHREAGAVPSRATATDTRRLMRFVGPIVAMAAVVLIAVLVRPPASSPVAPAATPGPASVAAPARPTFVVPVEPAAVKLTAAALIRRSAGQRGIFTDDAAPAFAAYRAGRYAEAAEAFASLSASYPASPEAAFYLGVSRLLTGDAPGATSALTAARRLNDPAFRDDVAWYLAAADERGGDIGAARQELNGLCQGQSAFAARACDAAAKLPSK
jgi:TolA-binding protein